MNIKQPLLIYNTLSRQKETFKPQQEGKVKMYVCGVTVYDHCHLGHARAYVAFDTVRRILQYFNYDVTYVQNFTDIDDKIIARCNELGTDLKTLTNQFIDSYHEDMKKLNILPATFYPKATKHIDSIIAMIKTLIDKNCAYSCDGDVYFDVNSAKEYGRLSNKVLEDLLAGARVELGDKKKNPLDFVLWKKAKENEPFWNSPWGNGRPGWHIECSAMAKEILGEHIDIHAGGNDLIFPHHENEIAQSECANGCCFSSYWMHNGFVNLNDRKMSKSTQNFITLKQCLKSYSGEALRFFLLKTHYRHPLQFSKEGLDEATNAYARLCQTVFSSFKKEPCADLQSSFLKLKQDFLNAIANDFNAAEAIGFLFDINKLCNQSQSGKQLLKELGSILGLFTQNPVKKEVPEAAMLLINKRTQARKDKNFELSDQLRDQLLNEFNIQIKDTREGVIIL